MLKAPRLAKLFWGCLPVIAILLSAGTATAQGPTLPGASEGMPWQVAALFTANWVLVAAAVAMMSRPSKRSDKPKKPVEETQA
jgi:hypothetical protein